MLKKALLLAGVALAKVIIGRGRAYHFDESQEGIRMARLEFVQHAAVVFTEFEENILNDVVDHARGGFPPKASYTQGAERDRP